MPIFTNFFVRADQNFPDFGPPRRSIWPIFDPKILVFSHVHRVLPPPKNRPCTFCTKMCKFHKFFFQKKAISLRFLQTRFFGVFPPNEMCFRKMQKSENLQKIFTPVPKPPWLCENRKLKFRKIFCRKFAKNCRKLYSGVPPIFGVHVYMWETGVCTACTELCTKFFQILQNFEKNVVFKKCWKKCIFLRFLKIAWYTCKIAFLGGRKKQRRTRRLSSMGLSTFFVIFWPFFDGFQIQNLGLHLK